MKWGILLFCANIKFLVKNVNRTENGSVWKDSVRETQDRCFEGQFSLKYVINLRIYYFYSYWEVNTRLFILSLRIYTSERYMYIYMTITINSMSVHLKLRERIKTLPRIGTQLWVIYELILKIPWVKNNYT